MVFHLLVQYFRKLSRNVGKNHLNSVISINKQSFLSTNTICLDLDEKSRDIKLDLTSDSNYDFSNLNNLC